MCSSVRILHFVSQSKGSSRNRLTTDSNPVACGGLKPFLVKRRLFVLIVVFVSTKNDAIIFVDTNITISIRSCLELAQFPEVGVLAVASQQRLVVAHFDDAAPLKHHDDVGMTDRRKAMRDNIRVAFQSGVIPQGKRKVIDCPAAR
jgi:hypothetical protein